MNWLISLTGSVVLAALLVVAPTQRSAHAITINIEYTDEGDPLPHDENPTWDPGGMILKAHFEAAKDIWETLLPGGGTYSFDFHWDNDIDGLGLYTTGVDEFIEINPDYDWYADPNLDDDAEFSAGVQKLYNGLSTSDRSTFFPGTAPPGALEVSFRGAGLLNGTLVNGSPVNTLSASGQIVPGTSTPVDASNGTDLLSVILHEIGHALGISGVEPGDYNIDPQHVGGTTGVLVLDHPDSGHLGGDEITPGFLMNPFTPRGTRVFATATDVLAIAEDQGITVVQLARVGRISSGVWNDANAWIGGDVPDGTQDAYISHGGTVTLNQDAHVQNMLVAPGNTLAAGDRRFSTQGTLTFNGGALSVGSLGEIAVNNLVGDPSTLTTPAGSLVRFNQFTRGSSSATAASFGGSVGIGYYIPSAPPTTFNPNPITTWTVAQNLSIGDESDAGLIVNNSTWTVGGNVKVGGNTAQLAIQTSGTMTVGGNLEVSGDSLGFSDATVDTGGTLDVTGDVIVGAYGRMAYKTGTLASGTTFEIRGGSTGVGGNPPTIPYHFVFGAGGALSIEGTANVFESSFDVDGGTGNGAPSGSVTFKTGSNASNAEFRTRGGHKGGTSPVLAELELAGVGGLARFGGNARAHRAEFVNEGVTEFTGGTGGRTIFDGTSRADWAVIDNHGSTYSARFGTAPSGATHFLDRSTADDATITNHGDGRFLSLDQGAHTIFRDFSDAGTAEIENRPATDPLGSGVPGRTEFRGNSTADEATIHNRGHIPVGGLAGRTLFFDSARAGTATIHTYEGYVDAGRIEFHGSSSAQDAHIFLNNVPEIVGSTGNGGWLQFFDDSTAGTSDITLRAGACCNGVQFYDNASAADAEVIQEDGAGTIAFYNESRAGNSATTARSSFSLGQSGVMTFYDQSSADDAAITLANRARLSFVNNASAGQAEVAAAGGSTYTAGARAEISFITNATAANAAITVNGASASLASPAVLSFTGGATSGNATIIANGGTNGGAGASIVFNGAANGSTARLVANAGTLVDFLDQRNFGDVSFGSIEGAGNFALRGAHVNVGSRNTDTAVSGPIVDSPPGFSTGGRLTKVGLGKLTLAGANTYSGFTTIDDGTVSVTGSIAGGAIVNDGGTLNGTGTIVGGVTINAGGVFAPGASPGTITIDGLAMNSGGILNFEIGNAARDHIVLTNNGNITLDGTLNLSLIGGFAPTLGQSFPLFEGAIGSITGAFDFVNAPFFNGLTLNVLQSANSVSLQVGEPASLSADFDGDGDVDGADLTQWKGDFGVNNLSDADDDGDSDGADFLAWQQQVGSVPAAPAGGAVPEPGASALIAAAALGGFLRRRRS